MSDDKKRIGFDVPEELKREIRVEAAKRDMPMAELLREILREEFEVPSEGNPRTKIAAN